MRIKTVLFGFIDISGLRSGRAGPSFLPAEKGGKDAFQVPTKLTGDFCHATGRASGRISDSATTHPVPLRTPPHTRHKWEKPTPFRGHLFFWGDYGKYLRSRCFILFSFFALGPRRPFLFVLPKRNQKALYGVPTKHAGYFCHATGRASGKISDSATPYPVPLCTPPHARNKNRAVTPNLLHRR